MDIAEIKKRKQMLRLDIWELVSKFEKDTGVIVDSLEIYRSKQEFATPDIISILIKVDLG